MSDYLGALRRMAGAPAAGGAARAAAFEIGSSPSRPVRDVAGAPGLMSQDAFANAHSAAQSSAPGDPAPAPAPAPAPVAAHAMTSSGSALAAARLTQGRPAAPDLARHGIDVCVHPAIQAALRWVSGDPVAAPGDADHPAPRQASSQASTAPNSHKERFDSTLARSTPVAPALDHSLSLAARTPGSASPAAGAPSPTTSPFAHELALDLDLPGSVRPLRAQSRRAQADQVGAHADYNDAATSGAPDRVEISIGSIHVSVDAPAAPRSVAPPQPATTQAAARANTPAAANASAHNAFSRSRLPRR